MPLVFLILITVSAWIFSFRSFLTGKSALLDDAVPYIEHIRFYIHNLASGVYPLWDPTYQAGVPTEFFLRRIGSFNPVYLIPTLFYKLGFDFQYIYLGFLGGYFLLGMFGFYLLAQLIFQDRKTSFLCMALLMFSSQATRLFDSYIMLVFVPMVWFFYFLIKFMLDQKRFSILGMTLTLVILLTTYIPLYFGIIFITFLFCLLIFYPKKIIKFFQLLSNQIIKNSILIFICLLGLVWAMIPGYLLFTQAKNNWIIFPVRHTQEITINQSRPKLEFNQLRTIDNQTGQLPLQQSAANNDSLVQVNQTPDNKENALEPSKKFLQVRNQNPEMSNQLSVNYDTVRSWGIEEDVIYSLMFSNLKKFKFAVLYVPLIAFLILMLGLITQVNRLFLFFMAWSIMLFFIMSTYTPVNAFLYEHISYFKYFRNLHFFLWLILLPLFILMIGEQYKGFVELISGSKRGVCFVFTLIVHGIWFWVLSSSPNALVTSYMTLILSLLFWTAHFLGLNKKVNDFSQMFVILGLAIIQPMEVYHYLAVNSLPEKNKDKYYVRLNNFELNFPDAPKVVKKSNGNMVSVVPENLEFYYTLKWVKDFHQHFASEKTPYVKNTFSLYDHVEHMPIDHINFNRMSLGLETMENTAFVISDQTHPEHSNDSTILESIVSSSMSLKLLKANVNLIQIKTNFVKDKFLVYWDAYHPYWQGSIDGQLVKVNQTNLAFKGFWVPAGQHEVVLRYGSLKYYFFNLGLLFYTTILFFLIIFDVFKIKRHPINNGSKYAI